jgi:hypothetical protein
MENELWTVEELARRWRLKPSWLYQHMGELPHIKLGNLVRFDPQELESFHRLASRRPAAQASQIGKFC